LRFKTRLDALLVSQKKTYAMVKTLNVGMGDSISIEEGQLFNESRRSGMLMTTDNSFR